MPLAYLSIEDLSRETQLEESLLRFYESEYPRELPKKILKGGTFFFDSRAVEAFRKVHLLHGAKGTGEKEFVEAARDKERPPVQEKEKRDETYARVLAVTSGKGGVGKTNLALNLAIEMQRLGKMAFFL